MNIFGKFGIDVALYVSSDYIQIGTSRENMTIVPAYVAIHSSTKRILAVGGEAKEMAGKEPGNIAVHNIFKLGMPWDFDLVEAFFRYCFKKYLPWKFVPPRVVLSGQLNIDTIKRAFKESATSAGARDLMLLEGPMAAAIGLGLKIELPELRVLLHFERDWMVFSVISLAGIVALEFAPIGFDSIIQDIAIYANETMGFVPESKSLESHLLSTGFDSSIDTIGWESWIASIEVGRESAQRIDASMTSRACTPTILKIRQVYSKCLHQIDKSKRIQLNASPIHFTGSFSNVPGFAKILEKHLGKEVLSYTNSSRAAYDGTIEILSQLSSLIEFVEHKPKKK